MLLVWCIAAVVGATCTPNRRVLPSPLTVEADGCCTALSAGLVPNVTGAAAESVVDAWLPANASTSCAATPVTRLDVVIAPRASYDDVTYARWQVLNESYAISCAVRPENGGHESACTVQATTAIGARYGLDTLAQLYATGVGPAHIKVEDEPTHAYRGLMVDLGRRFVPLSWFDQTLAGMEAARLNVLHLHLSDFCRFALDLPAFPQVKAAQTGLLEGTYSVAQMRALVRAAARRGIRVVPEVDVPGHAQGLVPLGVETCAANASLGGVRPEQSTQLRDSSATRDVLARLFTELRDVFEESQYMHVGGDETANVGACTTEGSAQRLEVWTMSHIHQMNRTALVWGDIVAPTGADVVRETWGAQQGGSHRVVDAQLESSYLDFPKRSPESFWREVPVSAENLGGEAVIWTDSYCHSYQCGAASPDVAVAAGSAPRAPGLFGRAHDAEFEASLSGLVWPRAFVKGAALYRFGGVPMDSLLASAADKLAARGVDACPPGCTCDETTRCGNVYGAGEPLTCFAAVSASSFAGAARVYPRLTSRAEALRLCLWRRCTGVACAADGQCVPVGDPLATPAELSDESGAVAYVRLTNSTDPVCTGIPAQPASFLRTEEARAEETPERGTSFLRRPSVQ